MVIIGLLIIIIIDLLLCKRHLRWARVLSLDVSIAIVVIVVSTVIVVHDPLGVFHSVQRGLNLIQVIVNCVILGLVVGENDIQLSQLQQKVELRKRPWEQSKTKSMYIQSNLAIHSHLLRELSNDNVDILKRIPSIARMGVSFRPKPVDFFFSNQQCILHCLSIHERHAYSHILKRWIDFYLALYSCRFQHTCRLRTSALSLALAASSSSRISSWERCSIWTSSSFTGWTTCESFPPFSHTHTHAQTSIENCCEVPRGGLIRSTKGYSPPRKHLVISSTLYYVATLWLWTCLSPCQRFDWLLTNVKTYIVVICWR